MALQQGPIATIILIAALLLPFLAVDGVKEFIVRSNVPLQSLQGASLINRKQPRTSLSITLAPLRIRVPVINGMPLISFTASAYEQDGNGAVLPFAPTIRVRRGGTYSIKLTNGLVQPATNNSSVHGGHSSTAESSNGTIHNWWHNPMDTNLHTHGMHAELGVPSQEFAASGAYLAGDNPFFKLPARSSPEEPPSSKVFKLKLPKNHLPGLLWFHPHQHGSTIFQAGTAHGAIIVEDDNKLWLPAENGCGEVAATLEQATDTILDVQFYFFAQPNPGFNRSVLAPEVVAASEYTDNIHNGNFQFYSAVSDPKNPLCCDGKGNAINRIRGTASQGRGQNFFLINGGYQPQISLMNNTWARWRFLYSASKGFIVVKIVDAVTNQTSDQCEMMLLAKDGVYVMQIPRRIDGLLLASGNRAEILVKCIGDPGKKYYLWAGDSEPFSSNDFGDNEDLNVDRLARHIYYKQDILASIVLAPAAANANAVLSQPLTDRKCIPRRPPYAADLRNASLQAAGVNASDIMTFKSGFRSQELPATANSTISSLFLWGCGVQKSDGEYYVFSLPDPLPWVMQLGKIMQVDFTDFEFHPMHIHINPYQLVDLETNTDRLCTDSSTGEVACCYTTYFETGDFHDTLTLPIYQIPRDATEAVVPVRMQPGEFAGYTVMHCHFLNHEDSGCMTVVWFKCPSKPDDEQYGACLGFKWLVPADVSIEGQINSKV